MDAGMMPWWIASVGAVPGLLLLVRLGRLNPERSESLGHRHLPTLLGALIMLPVIPVELALIQAERVLPTLLARILYDAFVVAAVTEEFSKLGAVRLAGWLRPGIVNKMTATRSGAVAGLGFAIIENIKYLHSAESLGQMFGMLVSRGLMAVPMHAACGALPWYFAARKRATGKGPSLWGGYALAVALHGAYDSTANLTRFFFTAERWLFVLAGFGLSIFLGVWSIRLVVRLVRGDVSAREPHPAAAPIA
jgi:RsiW-degrading membrane proteinase PrsW (M82 family)